MGDCDECNRTEFCLKCDYCGIENRPCCTHPGAEQGAMSGRLMLGMVPCMFDRLSLSQSADGKEAEHQEDREIFEGAAFHRIMTFNYRRNVTGGSRGLSRR